MIEEILRRWRESTFDFREIASPRDHLSDRFEDWVSYYRLKAAIAATLRPATLLEIGVRYGYSYAAFKHGWPLARYVGIDLDVTGFGGEQGAIDWARRLARESGEAGGRDEFLVADTQRMERLPGDVYDLIHVDGQQDGDGSYRDLSLAIRQGRYVLLDGYLWTRPNFHSVSEFLYQHADAIEFSLLIPGYAGELLIKIQPAFLERERARPAALCAAGSEAIRAEFTADYYRRVLPGWPGFRRHRGRRLGEARLRSLLDLALAGRPERLLDLGCGRGEIAYQAARAGVEVTAVDYSPAALEMAKSCFEGEKALRERVEWICANAADLRLEGEYDAVIAGNLIEHMTEPELDRMYATVRRHLAPGGRFIVHAFPNAWFRRYDYARRRRQAAALGAFLPPDPRSREEQLLHLNEQSPPRLRRQLRRHFEAAAVWFFHPEEPAGSMARPMRPRELAACPDLCAMAAREPVDVPALARMLSMPAIGDREMGQARLRVLACPAQAGAGAEFAATFEVENAGETPLVSWPPYPLFVSYHWLEEETERCLIWDGVRTPLTPAALGGSRQALEIAVRAPGEPGNFRLQPAFVQEGIRWFGETGGVSAGGCTVRVLA
jgi:2-polyprenyl-3-methyl-5-hydroxy-6-metoxy-1,4-benzoquinol methylase